jgi:DNA-binding NarL/FixJ family response regulator
VIRVLIADDHAVVRQGLRTYLELQQDVEVVAEASDGEAAVTEAERLAPDVLLLDLAMPRLDGVAALRELRAQAPEARVLVLTSFGEDDRLFAALRAGAAGFLLKDASRERLLEGIRTVHSGDALLSPSITRRLIEHVAARAAPSAPPGALLSELTPREREMLVLVARGLSNGEIAARLVISEATVKSHVTAVLSKLGLRDRVQAVVFAYEHGIVVAGEPG